MTKRAISTDAAPKAIGPYSQAIIAGDLVFVSGQAGIDPATGTVAEGIEAQAEQALRNVAAIHARHLPDPAPARSTPILAALPRGFLISIEAIAVKPA